MIKHPIEFKKRVTEDENEQFTEQKEYLNEMLNETNSGLDKSTYDWAIESYINCQKNTDLESFSLFPNRIKIIEDCYLPNAIKNLKPNIVLKYNFSEIGEIFR